MEADCEFHDVCFSRSLSSIAEMLKKSTCTSDEKRGGCVHHRQYAGRPAYIEFLRNH